jgi:hypothetical protein
VIGNGKRRAQLRLEPHIPILISQY